VSELIGTLRAIVRDELARVRPPELATVTRVYARRGEGAKDNHQVNLRVRGSGVELTRVPVTVGRLGLSALPNEGDLVVVAFVGGDLNVPIVIGCLYDDQAHPPVAKPHEVVYRPPDDSESGVRRLHIELQNGNTLTVDDDKLEVAMGGTSLIITRDGDVEIRTPTNVKLSADGNVELSASGNLTIEAQGNLTLKGVTAALEAAGAAKVKGAQVTLAGMTQFSAA
jgi:phage baseplate assembly protein gpV